MGKKALEKEKGASIPSAPDEKLGRPWLETTAMTQGIPTLPASTYYWDSPLCSSTHTWHPPPSQLHTLFKMKTAGKGKEKGVWRELFLGSGLE